MLLKSDNNVVFLNMRPKNKITLETYNLHIADITIELTWKRIKNLYLSVHPPSGKIKISAPSRMPIDRIMAFAASKLRWIKAKQQGLINHELQCQQESLDEKIHYYKGNRYKLRIIHHTNPPKVHLNDSTIDIYVRPNTTKEKLRVILDDWYRQQLKTILPPLIAKWEAKIGVKVKEFGIKKMKTRWGTCNSRARRIWLNLELAKKPIQCIEYVLLHEIIHLIEKNHKAGFTKIMNHHMPEWKEYKKELNRLPIGFESPDNRDPINSFL